MNLIPKDPIDIIQTIHGLSLIVPELAHRPLPFSDIDAECAHRRDQCLRDVVALSTLTAVWHGAAPVRIAESLAASLFTTLRPQFVYVCLQDRPGKPPVSVAQTDRYHSDPALAKYLTPAISSWVQSHDPDELLEIQTPLAYGIVQVTARSIGFDAELGIIAAGFAGDSLPGPIEHLLLNIGATQAASAIQNARLIAKAEKEIAERELAEERLHKRGERLQLLADTLAQLLDARDTDTLVRDLFPKISAHLEVEAHFNFIGSQNLPTSPDFSTSSAHPSSFPCYSCNPLQVSGRLLGTLSFASRSRPPFDPDELQFLRVISQHTAVALDRLIAEEHLEKTVDIRTSELRAINEQLEAFIYSIAHDLRAPLRSMTGYSHLLIEDHAPLLNDDAKALLTRIQTSAEFMDKLLLDLLAYSRTARAEIQLSAVPIQRCWNNALFQCNSQIEQTAAQIDTTKPLPSVLAHEATLTQCLANLLANSLKFVPPGRQPNLKFWADSNLSKTRLWLQDNGIGIPQDQHERIFRVFERLHGSRYPGTGIGLSIVRKGVERMGGLTGIESQPDHGSRFWIELPTAPRP